MSLNFNTYWIPKHLSTLRMFGGSSGIPYVEHNGMIYVLTKVSGRFPGLIQLRLRPGRRTSRRYGVMEVKGKRYTVEGRRWVKSKSKWNRWTPYTPTEGDWSFPTDLLQQKVKEHFGPMHKQNRGRRRNPRTQSPYKQVLAQAKKMSRAQRSKAQQAVRWLLGSSGIARPIEAQIHSATQVLWMGNLSSLRQRDLRDARAAHPRAKLVLSGMWGAFDPPGMGGSMIEDLPDTHWSVEVP